MPDSPPISVANLLASLLDVTAAIVLTLSGFFGFFAASGALAFGAGNSGIGLLLSLSIASLIQAALLIGGIVRDALWLAVARIVAGLVLCALAVAAYSASGLGLIPDWAALSVLGAAVASIVAAGISLRAPAKPTTNASLRQSSPSDSDLPDAIRRSLK